MARIPLCLILWRKVADAVQAEVKMAMPEDLAAAEQGTRVQLYTVDPVHPVRAMREEKEAALHQLRRTQAVAVVLARLAVTTLQEARLAMAVWALHAQSRVCKYTTVVAAVAGRLARRLRRMVILELVAEAKVGA